MADEVIIDLEYYSVSFGLIASESNNRPILKDVDIVPLLGKAIMFSKLNKYFHLTHYIRSTIFNINDNSCYLHQEELDRFTDIVCEFIKEMIKEVEKVTDTPIDGVSINCIGRNKTMLMVGV